MILGLPISAMIAFLLVMARVAGLVTFLPIPGFRNAPDLIRVVLALAFTFALFPVWPSVPNVLPSFGDLIVQAFAEAGFGLVAGLAIAFLTEGFQLAAQVLGLQAGYGYASTIDPSSQADSSVLQLIIPLMTALLFFTTPFDRNLVPVPPPRFVNYPP